MRYRDRPEAAAGSALGSMSEHDSNSQMQGMDVNSKST